jgi:hypothetical protein
MHNLSSSEFLKIGNSTLWTVNGTEQQCHISVQVSRHLDCYVTYRALRPGQRDNAATTLMEGEVGAIQILSSASWKIYLVHILFCGELQLYIHS